MSSITGGVEIGESPIQAAVRELAEEAGIQADLEDFLPLGEIFAAKCLDTLYTLFTIDITECGFLENGTTDGSAGEALAHNELVDYHSLLEDSADAILHVMVNKLTLELLKSGEDPVSVSEPETELGTSVEIQPNSLDAGAVVENFKESIKKLEAIKLEFREGLPLKEFTTGRTYPFLVKVFSVISKKTGLKFNVSPVDEQIKNSHGTFLSYSVGMSGNKLLRVNFLPSGIAGTNFASIDFWANPLTENPSSTLSLNGFNVVQVLSQIGDFLKGHLAQDIKIGLHMADEAGMSESLTEASISDLIAKAAQSDQAFQAVINKPNKTDTEVHAEVMRVLSAAGKNSSMQPASAVFYVRKVLSSLGGVSAKKAATIPAVAIVPPPTRTVTFVDPDMQASFEESEDTSPRVKMREFEYSVRLICEMNPEIPGAIAYGKSGVGKDFVVDRIAEDTGAPLVHIGGVMGRGGKTGLLQILFENANGKVIKFTDCDMVWDDTDMINILKTALDLGAVKKMGTGIEMKIDKDLTIPAEFEFSSKIIFLSNVENLETNPKFDAIMGRLSGDVYKLNFTEKETLEFIKEELAKVTTGTGLEVDMSIKLEVYNFIETFLEHMEAAGRKITVDFRRFKKALSWRTSCPPDQPRMWMSKTMTIFKTGN
jgi:hypothetical protein